MSAETMTPAEARTYFLDALCELEVDLAALEDFGTPESSAALDNIKARLDVLDLAIASANAKTQENAA